MRREGTIGPITNVQVVEGPSSFCTATFIADEIEALLILRFAKKNDPVDSSILIVVVDRFTRVHIGLKVFFEFGGITFDPDVLAKRRCSVFTIDIIADKMGIGGAPLGTRKFYRLPESGIFNRCSAVASILQFSKQFAPTLLTEARLICESSIQPLNALAPSVTEASSLKVTSVRSAQLLNALEPIDVAIGIFTV